MSELQRFVGRALGTSALAAALFSLAPGCSSKTDAVGPTLCTAGSNVNCKCKDLTPGTKRCRDDGQGFEACVTSSAGECAGGEFEEGEDAGVKPQSKCPGKALDIVAGTEKVVEGDTTGLGDGEKGKAGSCAAGEGGADQVYHFKPGASGALTIKVEGTAPFDPTIYVRTTCSDVATEAACSEKTSVGGTEEIKMNVVAEKDYFLVIDGASGSAGKFKLSIDLASGSFCGDTTAQEGEACDDGNTTAGDGCSADCKNIEGNPASAGSCPGQGVHLWPGQKVTGTGTTTTYGNTFTKTGSSCLVSTSNLNAAPDHIYAVTSHGSGKVKVVVTPTDGAFDPLLIARATCADPESQAIDMCANQNDDGAAETLIVSNSNGETIYIGVDGAINSKGDYAITFELVP